jgi:hypothetical protein
MSKKKRIFIRAEDELLQRMEKAAELEFEGNVSLFARAAFKEKLEKLAKKHPEHKDELAPAA